jgi:hypothetical protein
MNFALRRVGPWRFCFIPSSPARTSKHEGQREFHAANVRRRSILDEAFPRHALNIEQRGEIAADSA